MGFKREVKTRLRKGAEIVIVTEIGEENSIGKEDLRTSFEAVLPPKA